MECDGVARPARRHSSPKDAPDPQFTIKGRRPEVSSNASVEAWAIGRCRPLGGALASMMTLVRPADRRANPIDRPSGCASCARRGQRMIQPAFLPAPATVKPRKPAVGMAQGAQRRGNPLNRGQMRLRRRRACIDQRGCRPRQQREDIQQFFGVAGGQAALSINLRSHSRASALIAGSANCSIPSSDRPA